MAESLINRIVILFYKHPRLSSGVTFVSIGVFLISGVHSFNSDFNNSTSIYICLLSLISSALLIYVMSIKKSIVFTGLHDYFNKNRDCVASEVEINFFIRESHAAGFGEEFESYLSVLGRKPLIRECMNKALELKKIKSPMDA